MKCCFVALLCGFASRNVAAGDGRPERSATSKRLPIQRAIRKPPRFASRSRVYCLLTFAGKSQRVPVWVIVDGDRLYVDRNANGDLTDAGERFDAGRKRDITTGLTHPHLRRRYSKLQIRWANPMRRKLLIVSVTVGGVYRLQSIQEGDTLADKPGDAPIVRFGGALQVSVFGKPEHALWRGNNARTILPVAAGIGTKSQTGAWAYVLPDSLPEGVHAVAKARYLSKTADRKRIVASAPLKTRGLNYFGGTLTAPSNARPGSVQVTVELNDAMTLKGRTVKPATVKTTLPKFRDLPVIDPKPARGS